MKLVSFIRDDGAIRTGVVAGDRVLDLHAMDATLPADMCALLAGGQDSLDRIGALLGTAGDAPRGTSLPLEGVRLACPVQRPEKILGIGLNYKDHCREMGSELPTTMRVFAMFANGLVGHRDAIELPKTSSKMDYEAELVVVIGKNTRYVSEDDALDHVAGFTIGNDISARDHQADDPLTMRGKCGDTHAPAGPWIVTRDELPDPSRLDIELKLNGRVMQSSNTEELIFTVPHIVSFLSRYYTLRPGDLIFTGTPPGVGSGRDPQVWLQPGDQMDVSIEGIGTLSNTCVAEA